MKSYTSRILSVVIALLALIVIFVPQPVQAAALSTYLQNKYIDWILRAQTYTPPSTVYVALATTSSGASACGTEVSGGSYARVAVTASLTNWAGTQSAGSTAVSSGSSGQTSNNGSITFPALRRLTGHDFDRCRSASLTPRAAGTCCSTLHSRPVKP